MLKSMEHLYASLYYTEYTVSLLNHNTNLLIKFHQQSRSITFNFEDKVSLSTAKSFPPRHNAELRKCELI